MMLWCRGGYTALHAAAMKNEVNMAELLLQNGADVNAKDKEWVAMCRVCIGEAAHCCSIKPCDQVT